jgi:hypothetical protein
MDRGAADVKAAREGGLLRPEASGPATARRPVQGSTSTVTPTMTGVVEVLWTTSWLFEADAVKLYC